MHTSADGAVTRIEKQGYASHTLETHLEADRRPLSSPNILKVEQRAVDHTVLTTQLPDGSNSQSFRDIEKTGIDGEEGRWRHAIKRADLSVVVIDETGRISLISSNARAALNELGGKNKLDSEEKDHDYLIELARPDDKCVPTVYQALISTTEGESCIRTVNARGDTVYTLR